MAKERSGVKALVAGGSRGTEAAIAKALAEKRADVRITCVSSLDAAYRVVADPVGWGEGLRCLRPTMECEMDAPLLNAASPKCAISINGIK